MRAASFVLSAMLSASCATSDNRAIKEITLSTEHTEVECDEWRWWVFADGATRIARERCVSEDNPLIPTVWQYRRGTVKPADFERLIKLVYFADFERLDDYYPG